MNNKVVFSIIGVLTFVGVGIVYYFVIRFWLSKDFSPEVDAAVITALVTIPLGLATILGTVWISIVSNRKVVETSIMQQRVTMRDELFKKRIEIYETLFLKTHEARLSLVSLKDEPNETLREIDSFHFKLKEYMAKNIFYFSDLLLLLVYGYLEPNYSFSALQYDFQHEMDTHRKIQSYFQSEQFKKYNLKKYKFPMETIDRIADEMQFPDYNIISIWEIEPKWVKKNLHGNLMDKEFYNKLLIERFVGHIQTDRKRHEEQRLVPVESLERELEGFYNHLIYLINIEINFDHLERDFNKLFRSKEYVD